MQTIGILAILATFFGIIGVYVRGFQPLNAISFVLLIVILIILFLALGVVKEANYALNNANLVEFRSKIRAAYILWIIAMPFLFLALFLIFEVARVQAIITGIIFFVIFCILALISGILRIQGWGSLKTFFKENQGNFPIDIANKARSGAALLMIGAIFYITVILLVFGLILDIVGFFLLGSLKKLSGAPAAQPAAQPAPAPAAAPAPAPAAVPAKKFCPNCGSPVSDTEKYCAACGSEI